MQVLQFLYMYSQITFQFNCRLITVIQLNKIVLGPISLKDIGKNLLQIINDTIIVIGKKCL